MNKVDSSKVLYPDLSYQIMKFVFEVHNQLGPGFTEDIYERALMVEFERNGIPFKSQHCIDVYYKGENLGVFRIDLVVDDKIILELKAVKELTELFRQQLLSYLRASGLHLGILINFGGAKIQHVRIVS